MTQRTHDTLKRNRDEGDSGLAEYCKGLNTSRVFIFSFDGRSFAWTDSLIKAAHAVPVLQGMGYEVRTTTNPAHTVYDICLPDVRFPEKKGDGGGEPDAET